jgi:signal transduction histidine kinase
MEIHLALTIILILLAMGVAGAAVYLHLNRKIQAMTGKLQMLSAEASRLDAIFQTAPAALAVLDRNLCFLRANQCLARLSSVKNETIRTGSPLGEVLPDLAASIPSDLIQALEAQEAISPIELQMKHPQSDRSMNVRAELSALRGPQDEFLGIHLVLRDVSEELRTQAELRASAARIQLATRIAKFVIYEWDLETGRVIRESGMQETLGAYAKPGVTNVEEWRKKVHPVDLENVLKKAEKDFASGADAYEDEYRVLNAQNEYIYIWDRGIIFRDDKGQLAHALGVSIDIDSRKKLEAKLQQYTQELAEADRRKDEFISMMSHELRNPLMPIQTGIAVLSQMHLRDDAAAQTVALISRQVAHMSRIIDDLLDISRIKKGTLLIQKQRLDFSELVKTVITDYKGLIQDKGLSLQTSLIADPLWIEGDETRLSQAFGNILHNSLKYTPSGGQIAMEVEADPERKWVMLSIRDTGAGIPAELLPKIFEGFTQGEQGLDRSKGGLGLGLALVKFIVDEHGGAIQAFSAGAQQGTQFLIKLPLVASLPAHDENSRREKAANTSDRRVLVIEDQPDILAVLKLYLQEILGLEVLTAEDGKTGIALAQRQKPDAILCDIGLPGEISGYDVARNIRSMPDLASVKLIALTGYGTEEDQRRSLAAGFHMHMTKPPDIEALQKVLMN